MAKNQKPAILTDDQIRHLANLSHLSLDQKETQKVAKELSWSLDFIATMTEMPIKNVEPTHQVTDLENIWREDEIDQEKTFTQEEALAGAAKSHEGYFVVGQIIDQDAHA